MCDKVCLHGMSTSFLSCDESTFPGDETLREVIYDNTFLLEDLSSGRYGELRESLFLHLLFLKVYITQSNQYTKMAYFGVVYSELQ